MIFCPRLCGLEELSVPGQRLFCWWQIPYISCELYCTSNGFSVTAVYAATSFIVLFSSSSSYYAILLPVLQSLHISFSFTFSPSPGFFNSVFGNFLMLVRVILMASLVTS
jgi:hypothetical protein